MKKTLIFLSFISVLALFSACGSPPEKKAEENKSVGNTSTETKKEAPPLAQLSTNVLQSEFKLSDGKTVKLESYKGKVVLINLWATWCLPCKKEMPELVKLQTEFKDKGLEIIGLTIDNENDTPDKVKKFVSEQNLNYQIGWLNGNLKNELEKDELTAKLEKSKDAEKADKEALSQVVPKNFLINQKGEIVFGYIGFSEQTVPNIKKKIEELLPKN